MKRARRSALSVVRDGEPADPSDPLVRRQRFETAHPRVTIIGPAGACDFWTACFQPGTIPAHPDKTTLSGWQLSDLMDLLDHHLPPGGLSP